VDVGRHAVRLREDIPGRELRLVPGAGHMVHHAAPGLVAEAVEAVAARSAAPRPVPPRLTAAADA
jgi:pimeloyl-ACP methyl ester carboxylesterase